MENIKSNSKLIGLLFFTGIFFATLETLSLSTANASPIHNNHNEIEVIGEDLPTNISGDFEITPSKTVKVTNPIYKKISQVKSPSKSYNHCYTHVLEQGGSPIARTVKVCY